MQKATSTNLAKWVIDHTQIASYTLPETDEDGSRQIPKTYRS